MDAKRQLENLLRIQELALEMRAAQDVVAHAPSRIEEIEGRFRERNAEYVALKERFEVLEKDQRDRSGELSVLEENLKRYMDHLMQVKNQREYAAMLKEIDTVKAQKGSHEETVLKNMEEIENLRADLDARAAHIAEERLKVEAEQAHVEADASAAREQIARCESERARVEAGLPRPLVENVRRVEEARQGIFLAKADGETCTACFVRVRPQVYQEIRQCTRIHSCANCRRYLYFEQALRGAPEPTAVREDLGAETADGGAI